MSNIFEFDTTKPIKFLASTVEALSSQKLLNTISSGNFSTSQNYFAQAAEKLGPVR